jgi:hypothetical protein
MSTDTEALEEFLKQIEDHYTAAELAELLDLSAWDLIESFREEIIDNSEMIREDMKHGR